MTVPQTEAKLSREIREEIEFAWEEACIQKNWGGRFSAKGIPDLTGSVMGRAVALEVKQPRYRSRVTREQKAWMERYRKSGAIVGVVTSIPEALQLIEDNL